MPGSGSSVGQISLDLGLNDAGFKKQVKGLEQSTKKAFTGLTSFISNFFANIMSSLLTRALSMIGQFVKDSINLASDLQEVENVVDTVFTNMERQVDSFARSAMESFGLSELVAKQYMGQLGAMAKAFGYTEEESYNLARSITGLTGDVASFYNISTDEAFTKLKSIFTGETESLKSLGIVMTQSALDAFALSQGIQKSTSDMSESEKVALRYKFVMNQLTSAQGDFTKTSDSWANQTRVLALQFDILKATLGEAFIIALTPVVKMLNTVISRMQTVAQAFTNLVKKVFGVTEETSMLEGGVIDASDATGGIAENMDKTAESAEKAKKSLMGFDELNKLSSSSGGKSSSASATGDLGVFDWGDESSTPSSSDAANNLVSSLSSAAAASSSVLATTFSDQIEAAKNFGNVFSEIVSSTYSKFVSSFGSTLSGIGTNIFENISTIFFSVVDICTEALNIITSSLDNAKEELSTGFSNLFGGIATFAGSSLEFVSGVAATSYSTLNEWLKKNNEVISTALTDIYASIGNTFSLIGTIFSDLGTSITSWWDTGFKAVFEGVIGMITDVYDAALLLWTAAFQPVLDNIISKLAELWDSSLKPLWDNILLLVTEVMNLVLMLWNAVIAPFAKSIASIFGPFLGEILNFAIDSVINFAKVFIEYITSTVQNVTQALGGLIKFLTGIFTGDFEKAWDGLLDILKAFVNALADMVELNLNIVIAAINIVVDAVLTAVIGIINNVIRASKTIAGLFTDTSGWNTISKPNLAIPTLSIPRLAEGGFLKANQPTLAIVGDNKREGEIVAPESKISDAVSRGISQALSMMKGFGQSESSQPIEVVVQIGDETIVDRVINGINRENRRAGRLVIKA